MVEDEWGPWISAGNEAMFSSAVHGPSMHWETYDDSPVHPQFYTGFPAMVTQKNPIVLLSSELAINGGYFEHEDTA